MKKSNKIIALGLMSGTSADGISISAIEILPDEKKLKVFYYKTYPYDAGLRKRILNAQNLKTRGLSELNFELGRLWAGYVKKFCAGFKIPLENIDVIGSHGQTVCHCPNAKPPNTLQIGEASFIAESAGVPVACDFRPRDMSAGGQGAPLIPFMDEYLFGSGAPVALQNIGGVGNISFVGRGVKTFGFDTGPGNSLMDAAVYILTRGGKNYDEYGRLAAGGKIDYTKILKLLKLPFFAMKPPKSLDRSEFASVFVKRHFSSLLKQKRGKDLLATLNYFTAVTIALAFQRHAPAGTGELIVSGGGVLNQTLMNNLGRLLAPVNSVRDTPVKILVKNAENIRITKAQTKDSLQGTVAQARPVSNGVKVVSISEYGIHPLAKESACFALLAYLCMEGKINNCSQVTGAAGPRVLGKLIK
ncbi:MAG: anhydro-N-acetylmuramic acid kinase [Elusimicrobia bacterium]|nr:anhydro-N-acetylmuramic acid kinase [Elusimicrobiota bacterium]